MLQLPASPLSLRFPSLCVGYLCLTISLWSPLVVESSTDSTSGPESSTQETDVDRQARPSVFHPVVKLVEPAHSVFSATRGRRLHRTSELSIRAQAEADQVVAPKSNVPVVDITVNDVQDVKAEVEQPSAPREAYKLAAFIRVAPRPELRDTTSEITFNSAPLSVAANVPLPAAEPDPVAEPVTSQAPVVSEPLSVVVLTPVQPSVDPIVRLASEPTPELVQQTPSASDLPSPTSDTPETIPPTTDSLPLADTEEIPAFESDWKSITDLKIRTAPEAGEMPENYAAARFAREGRIAHKMGISRETVESLFTWEAPANCYRPLLFEDVNLERHGYKVPLIQPALSAAHFFGRVPLVPYMMISEGHHDCRYALGNYRPGDYAPYSLYAPRLRLDATAFEAAVVAAVIIAFP